MRLPVILGGVLAIASLTAVSLAGAQTSGDPIGALLEKNVPKGEEPPPALAEAPSVTPVAPASPDIQAKAAPAAPAPAKLEPDRRPRYPIAILQALDKVTAQSMRFEAPVGQPVRYKNLVFTVRSCETTSPEEQADDAIAFVEVESQTPNPGRPALAERSVFKGWMFADSPSVNPMQHPVYDAWLIACKA